MKVGILGFGNVGAATVESFLANKALIDAKSWAPIEFIRVATRTPARAHGRVPEGCVVSADCQDVVNDPAIDVVLELTGDVPVARHLVLEALAQGKHVVTANKALLALHGQEIMNKADEVGRCVRFEGAVAVSIPIVKTLRESAAANRLTGITGILNGTSNFILSQMSERGIDFESALADAQRRGYAEADPTLDVTGADAAHKLALLASLAFGIPIRLAAIDVKGIRQIDPVDIALARSSNHQIKLIAQASLMPTGLSATVEPMLVHDTSLLATVGAAMNGIVLHGDLLGTAFLYGAGAGGKETASAVLADLMELANQRPLHAAGGTHNMGFRSHSAPLACVEPAHRAYYLRMRVDDHTAGLAGLTQALDGADVAIESVVTTGACPTDVGVITRPLSSSLLPQVLAFLEESTGPGQPVAAYPILRD